MKKKEKSNNNKKIFFGINNGFILCSYNSKKERLEKYEYKIRKYPNYLQKNINQIVEDDNTIFYTISDTNNMSDYYSEKKGHITFIDEKEKETIFKAHEKKINQILISNSVIGVNTKKKLITCSDDGEIKFWDLENKTLLKTFKNYNNKVLVVPVGNEKIRDKKDAVNCIAEMDGYFFSGDGSNTPIQLWEINKNITDLEIEGNDVFTAVNALLIIDKRFLIAGRDNGCIYVYEIEKNMKKIKWKNIFHSKEKGEIKKIIPLKENGFAACYIKKKISVFKYSELRGYEENFEKNIDGVKDIKEHEKNIIFINEENKVFILSIDTKKITEIEIDNENICSPLPIGEKIPWELETNKKVPRLEPDLTKRKRKEKKKEGEIEKKRKKEEDEKKREEEEKRKKKEEEERKKKELVEKRKFYLRIHKTFKKYKKFLKSKEKQNEIKYIGNTSENMIDLEKNINKEIKEIFENETYQEMKFENFLNDKRNVKIIEIFKSKDVSFYLYNGEIKILNNGEIKNKMKHGKYESLYKIIYSSNNKLKSKIRIYLGSYENDKKHGIGRIFRETDGRLVFYGKFKEGKKHGCGNQAVFDEHNKNVIGKDGIEKEIIGHWENGELKCEKGKKKKITVPQKDISKYWKKLNSFLNDNENINILDIYFKYLLGGGGFANVYLYNTFELDKDLKDKEGKKKFQKKVIYEKSSYAFKKFSIAQCKTPKEIKDLENMIKKKANIVYNLDHPNLIKVVGICLKRSLKGIIIEICKESIWDFSKFGSTDPKDKIPLKDKLDIILQTANGMEYLHKNHIMHRDLDWRNVLITNNGEIKICDFENSKLVFNSYQSKWGYNQTAIGKIGNKAPERNEGICFYQSDVFSFGIMMYELLIQNRAYKKMIEEKHKINEEEFIKSGKRPDLGEIKVDEKHSKSIGKLKILIKECWKQDYKLRPLFTKIVEELTNIKKEFENELLQHAAVNNEEKKKN